MSISIIINKTILAIARTTGIVMRETIKHSPDILLGAGVTFGAYGVVQSCRQTLTLDETIKPNMDKINKLHDIPKENRDKAYNKEIWKLTASTGLKIVGHYAEPLTIFMVSGFCIDKSVNILATRYLEEHTKRLADAAIFSRYRDFIRERDGEEVDRQAYYGLEDATVEKEVTDSNGKIKKKKSKDSIVFQRNENGRIVIPWTEENFELCKKRKIFGNSSVLYNYDYLISDQKEENICLKVDGVRTLAQWLIDHRWTHPIPPEAFITVWRNEPLDGTIDINGKKVPISYGSIDYGIEDDINADFRSGASGECILLLNCDLLPIRDEAII